MGKGIKNILKLILKTMSNPVFHFYLFKSNQKFIIYFEIFFRFFYRFYIIFCGKDLLMPIL